MDKSQKQSMVFYVIVTIIVLGVLGYTLSLVDNMHQLELEALKSNNYIEATYYATRKGAIAESLMLMGISIILLRIDLRKRCNCE